MNSLKSIVGAALLTGSLLLSSSAQGAEPAKSSDAKKAKPYPLKTCIVSDEKLGGDMGEPYVFIHEGQEIKLCCKSCLKDFNKEPAVYLKKLSQNKKSGKDAAPAQKHGAHGKH